MSNRNPQRRGRQQQQPPQHHNALDYSDSDKTDFTPYTQGGSNSYGGGGGGSVRYNGNGGGGTLGSDRTPYSYYDQDYEGGNTLDGSDRTPYTQYSYEYYENGNQLDYSESDRTPYSQRSQGQSCQSQSQSRVHHDSFNSNSSRGSAQPGRMHGSINYDNHNSDTHRQSYGTSYSHRSRQTNQKSQYGNASASGSTLATTVANGGRGRCPYQIGFHVQNAGKQMSTTKRIIHFRFGFAHPQALSQGKAGVDCRGQEHDLRITWSITGGKRQICIDGREIQYTAGKRANSERRADIMEAAWKMSDHVFELKCYAYAPKAGSPEKRNPKWKQYSLTIDGRSFFELPEIFDLGLKGLGTERLPSTISGGSEWDQTSAISSKTGVPSSSISSQYTDQSSVKDSIQSRIEEQRRLMNRKKQGSTTVDMSRPKCTNSSVTYDSASDLSSINLMSFRSMSMSDNQEDSGIYSSGVHSAEPSELREARNRQSAAGEQANGKCKGSNRAEPQQHYAPTAERLSTLGSQQQAQQPQRYQPKFLSAVSESSTDIVASRVQKQPPRQQSKIQGQERTNHMILAQQQPPTFEEITQALVPASFVPPQDAVQGHSQHERTPTSHQQPQSIPPPGNQPKTIPQQQPPRTSSSPQYQTQPTNNSQRSAQPRASSPTQFQPKQHEDLPPKPPQQPISDSLPKGVNKFAFY